MNAGLWLITWIVVMIIPTNLVYHKSLWRYIFMFIFALFFGGLIGLWAMMIDPVMIWYLILVKLFFTLIEWWFAKEDEDVDFRDFYRLAFWFGIVAWIIVLIIYGWNVWPMRSVNNANKFNQMIEFMPPGTPLFYNEIPNDMLRLATQELATNIVQRNIAGFSDVNVLSNHITKHNGRLVWVATIGRNSIADNRVMKLYIVDANNPEKDPEIIEKQYGIGEGLFYFPLFITGGIQGNAYYGISTANAYGRAYLTPDPIGNWKYVMSVYTIEHLSFAEVPNGVFVYDNNGFVEHHYDMNTVPEWITQIYDEGWLEGQISMWGSTRRGNGFDAWAGGLPWSAPSSDRVEISDDTRFIIDPDTNEIVALVAVDPIGPSQTVSGMFKFSRKGIQYYDLTQYQIMSGRQAENAIESHLKKPTTGEYQARMPLLYSVNGTYAWFVPIYWEGTQSEGGTDKTILLAGMGIVEANDVDHYAITMTEEGYKGVSLVAECKRRYGTGGETILSGVLENRFDYDRNGNTIYVLTIDGTNVAIYAERFDFHVISRVEKLIVGEEVSVIINESDEFIRFPD